MAMTERTTLHILTGDANVVAFDEEGAKGHGLGRAPIDTSALLGHLTPSLENFLHLSVQLEPLRDGSSLHSDHLQRLSVDTSGTDAAHLRRTFEASPSGTEPVLRLGLIRLALLELVFVILKSEVTDLLQLFVGGGAVLDEALLIDVKGGAVLLDLLVQLGLGEEGLIELVVTIAAVADHVDNDIGSPLVTVFHGRFKGGRYGQRVVAVAVEDGNIEGLAKVGAVRGRSGVNGVGGEANLIVDNDVDGTTDVEIGHTGKLHGLVDDALAGEGGVAVKEDGDAILPVDVAIAAVVLLGAGLAGHDGVDALQMGGVGNQTEVDLPPIRVGAVHAGSQMVLHVAADAPLPTLGLGVGIDVVMRALELGEDERHGLAHNVGQNVETASVRHTNDEAVSAELGGPVDAILEGGDDGLSAVQAESLGGIKLVGEEVLEGVGKAQPLENVELLLLVVGKPPRLLDALPDPIALVLVADVHVLNGEGAAVRLPEHVDDGAEGDLARHAGQLLEEALVATARRAAEVELAIEIARPVEAMIRGGELLGITLGQVGGIARVGRAEREGFLGVQPQRIQIAGHVARNLIGPDEMRNAEGIGLASSGPGQGRRRGCRYAGAGNDAGTAVVGLVVRNALLEILKVAAPRLVDAGGVGQPGIVHLLGVERSGSVQKCFVGMQRRRGGSGRVLVVVVDGGGGRRFESARHSSRTRCHCHSCRVGAARGAGTQEGRTGSSGQQANCRCRRCGSAGCSARCSACGRRRPANGSPQDGLGRH
mmetsp:Transcript_16692/g.47917  ORF Transcript_16692/g.47917 Transcript_16692/m.47917 type:complete len:764 (+) Transcript_16692:1121-3412(+)